MKLYSKVVFLTAILILVCSPGFSQEDTTRVLPDSIRNQQGNLPFFTSTTDELNSEFESQDISGLLQSSKDVFSSVAGYNFGNARFRIRGLNSDNSTVMINGIRVNDLESGWASWSNWGGLNDVTRWMEVKSGLTSSRYAFAGIGGYSYIDARASSFRKGVRISYAYSNRSYAHRVMATGSTGMMENGWAVTASASKRYSSEGFVEGTFFDSYSYFISAERKINDAHSIGFVGFGAPVTQGRQGLAVQEAYDLAGTNFYNPNWGYQNGVKRNAKESHNHEPMLIFNHYWKIAPGTTLTSALFASKGQSGITGLNWYDAKDPRPDYYKNLPSYYQAEYPDLAAQSTYNWQNDVNTRQINWDQLYFANGKNMYQVVDANGISGNTIVGNRAKYIVEDLRSDVTLYGVNMILQKRIDDQFHVSGGLNVIKHKSHNFKIVKDLLGSDFWLDLNRFAEKNSVDQSTSQSDLEQPNHVVYEGETFGYDYDLNITGADLFGQVEFTSSKMDAYLALSGNYNSFYRTGYMKNGNFPEDSEGDSETFSFINGGAKGGIVYKVTGRHYVTANLAWLTRAPLAKNVFLSPRTRNSAVSNVQNEEILAGDISYLARFSKLKVRATGFYNQVNNQTIVRNYYHEEYNTIVNYTMTGVDQLMTGVEFGAEYAITPSVTFNAVFAHGVYIYNSRPSATITLDNSSEVVAENRTVYLKNYYIGGMPQTAASGGVKYTGKKFWFAGVNFNYFANIWLDPNPDRRTAEAVEKFIVTDPQWNEALDQQKLENNYTMDIFAGKSWKIKKYFINVNLNINNVLNNTDFITGGFEQLRYDPSNINKFPPKYGYHLGTTYYAMVSLRF
jgi:hypothetical protein